MAKEALLCGSRQEVEQLLNSHFEGRILDLLTGEPELSPDSQV